ncbi:MAG: sugar ABC transporter substrate-binding protein [Chloroflexota bacterium]
MSRHSLNHRTLSRREMLRLTGMSVVGLTMAACTAPTSTPGTEDAADDSVPAADLTANITVFNQGGETTTAIYADAIARLNERAPGITVEDLYSWGGSWGEYINLLKLRVASGQPVDVIYIAIEGARELIFQDIITPMDDIIDADPELQRVVDLTEPVLHNALKGPDGATYFMTREWNNMIIHYNTEMFEKAGLEPPPHDWTWDDFVETAIQLTSGEGSEKVFGFAIPYFNFGLAPWWHTNGTASLTEDWTDSNLDDPKMLDSVKFLHSLVHEHGVSPAVAGTAPYELFQSGRTAMTGAGRWPLRGYIDSNFTTVDITPWPQMETGTTVFGSGGFSLNKDTPNLDAAIEVIKEFMSDATQLAFTNQHTSLPATRTVTEDNADFNALPASAHLFFDSLADIKPIPSPANFAEMEGIFMRNMDLIMGDSTTAEAGLEQAHTELSEAMQTLQERLNG